MKLGCAHLLQPPEHAAGEISICLTNQACPVASGVTPALTTRGRTQRLSDITSTMARRGAALLVVLALALLVSVHAGDYRNGRTRPLRDPTTLEWNYEPVHVMERHKLPKV